MTTLLVCLFIATVFPILIKGPLAVAMSRSPKGYNNRHPRTQQQALTGFGARAKAAHENSFEALAMFAPGALALVATDAVTPTAEICAMVFVASRIGYVLAYYRDLHVVRSTFWTVGFGISAALMWMAIP